MSVFIREVPFFPAGSLDGRHMSKFKSKSAEMQDMMRTLPSGRCIEVTRDSDDPKDLERKRAHWMAAAARAKMKVATKIVVNEMNDKVLRIWVLSK